MPAIHRRIVFITAPNEEEGARLAKTLVAESLAACVNIIPSIRSIYMWKGEVCDEREVLLVAKSSAEKFPALASRVASLHSYETPEVISTPIIEGSQAYLDWMDGILE